MINRGLRPQPDLINIAAAETGNCVLASPSCSVIGIIYRCPDVPMLPHSMLAAGGERRNILTSGQRQVILAATQGEAEPDAQLLFSVVAAHINV